MILGLKILAEGADRDRGGREGVGELDLGVQGGNEVRVVRVLDRCVEAEQLCEPLPVQWEPGRAESGGAHGAQVRSRPGVLEPVGIALERGCEGE